MHYPPISDAFFTPNFSSFFFYLFIHVFHLCFKLGNIECCFSFPSEPLFETGTTLREIRQTAFIGQALIPITENSFLLMHNKCSAWSGGGGPSKVFSATERIEFRTPFSVLQDLTSNRAGDAIFVPEYVSNVVLSETTNSGTVSRLPTVYDPHKSSRRSNQSIPAIPRPGSCNTPRASPSAQS